MGKNINCLTFFRGIEEARLHGIPVGLKRNEYKMVMFKL